MWQRTGVVLSLMWIVGAGYIGNDMAKASAGSIGVMTLQRCTPVNNGVFGTPSLECVLSANDAEQLSLGEQRKELAIGVITKLVATWALVYVAVFAVRWIFAGRRKS